MKPESTTSIIGQIIDLVENSNLEELHENYMADEISYAKYRGSLFTTFNRIRVQTGVEPFSREQFDEAWQYRCLAHENWGVVEDEAINVIFGWW